MFAPFLLMASCLVLGGFSKPVGVDVVASRFEHTAIDLPVASRGLQKRDADVAFDLGFRVTDKTLFSGTFNTPNGESATLSLNCVDCHTWGTITASALFPDSFGDLLDDFGDLNPLNDVSLALGFSGVGARVQVDMSAAVDGTVKIPLFVSETPLGIAIPGTQIGIVFSVDLVLGLSGEVATNAGFEVVLPDSSSFALSLDPSKDVVADFNGIATSLLPITTEIPANLTMALQLSVEAGVELSAAGLSPALTALAGALINIPEVTIGEGFATNETCLPVFADININAGASVDIGADIAGFELPGINPAVSTTFIDLATSTCFGDQTLSPPTATTSVNASVVCPVALATQTITTTPTQSLIACAVSEVLCPASLTQVILAEATQTITTSSCPLGPWGNSTMYAQTATALGLGTGTLAAKATSAPSLNVKQKMPLPLRPGPGFFPMAPSPLPTQRYPMQPRQPRQ
ncbi:hypothetical protein PFICI_12571 [Pestalotiopsis fici W106-1]|uniref:Cytochrome c domain-containing protein n=1 Tax=Pestalotiopsis fici (strain W106-1 / CGMCC3.15140) TaxID=1229662 RepID=W3WR44_PESFW|nr:uncharacterized protein PFICI_12571 [Pestalotiopsis fici W106-1]ETS75627.1 hypothetical protein PFICI_12571 [Pestalotiopsis fici W106-1]